MGVEKKEKDQSFFKTFDWKQLFWIFFIGCILGVVVETLWCLLINHVIESRKGLIYGPFNLVYGFGALFMTMGLYGVSKKNNAWVFVGGFLIGSIFEFACSWFQETVFGTISWDYSYMNHLALAGRINVIYSCFWGLLAIFWMRVILPRILQLVKCIPERVLKGLTIGLLVFLIFDSMISAIAVYRQTERYHGNEATTSFEKFLDKTYPDERLDKIYANMRRVPTKS